MVEAFKVGAWIFGGLLAEKQWNLKNVIAHKNGFVDLSYAASTEALK